MLSAREILVRRSAAFSVGPLSFDLAASQALAIVGENGAGKTSLLLTLLGKLKPSSGELKNNFSRCGSLGLGAFLFSSWSVGQNARWLAQLAESSLEETDLLRIFSKRKVAEISQGQKRAIELEILLGLKLPLYLLDEAFNHLDASKKKTYLHRIEEKISTTSSSFVMSFHQIDEVPSFFNERLVL